MLHLSIKHNIILRKDTVWRDITNTQVPTPLPYLLSECRSFSSMALPFVGSRGRRGRTIYWFSISSWHLNFWKSAFSSFSSKLYAPESPKLVSMSYRGERQELGIKLHIQRRETREHNHSAVQGHWYSPHQWVWSHSLLLVGIDCVPN